MLETKGVTVLDHDTGSQIDTSSQIDAWAIGFIDVIWLQPILEAFDDDASGFITITEVNTFTFRMAGGQSLVAPNRYRLMSSSLPRWLVFWAVGELNTSWSRPSVQ